MLPINRILKRKIRLVQSEVRMLQSYHDQCVELLVEYEGEFAREVQYFKNLLASNPAQDEEQNSGGSGDAEVTGTEAVPADPGLYRKTEDGWEKQPDPEPEHEEEKEAKDIPDWAKKLYKKIALATHPDKVTGHTMEQELVRRFLKAGKSYDTGEYEELVSIALDLNIDIDIGDEALHLTLNKQRDSLKKKISEIEGSLAWIWCENIGNVGLKAHILLRHLDGNVKISDVEDMIRKKEKEDAHRQNGSNDG